jgi:hypothetical protein
MGSPMCRFLLGFVAGAGLAALGQLSWATEVPAERTHVAAVDRDYLESWYAADPDRMGRALHPDMVKRYVDSVPSGRQVVHSLTRDQMVEMARGGGGSQVPAESRRISVDVLDVSGDIAVVRASSSEYLWESCCSGSCSSCSRTISCTRSTADGFTCLVSSLTPCTTLE